MNRRATLLYWCLLLAPFVGPAAADPIPDRPNIVLIFTDDQGYGDFGLLVYEEDVLTPHLDQLGRDGIVFADGYVTAPQCAPSRAALMTGRYQQRFGMEHIALGPLPLEETTVADRLAALGYRCGIVGKWHLEPNNACRTWAAENVPGYDPKERVWIRWDHMEGYRPEQRGFHDVFWGEFSNAWATYDLEGNAVDPPRRVQGPEYRVDSQTEAALAFLDRQDAGQPFFLYLAYYAPHVPLEALEEDLALFDESLPLRRRYGLAMIHAIDRGLGRIRDKLEEKGWADDTLIVFSSDNGAPLLAHMDNADTIEGNGWDGSLNTPLAGEKGMLAEGGIRVPFVVALPGTIPGGRIDPTPVSALDLTPTFLAAAGLEEMPAAFEGENLWPVLTGDGLKDRPLFWRFWGQSAVRLGDWKLLFAGDHEWLFNLSEDPGETTNLAAEHPEKVRELKTLLVDWEKGNAPARTPGARPLNPSEERWFDTHFPQLTGQTPSQP